MGLPLAILLDSLLHSLDLRRPASALDEQVVVRLSLAATTPPTPVARGLAHSPEVDRRCCMA